jgi:hypothetical protein
MTYGITSSTTCPVMCGIVGHMIRHMTEAVTCPAPGQIARRTMYDTTMYITPQIALRTMTEIALLTMYHTTVRATPRTMRRAIPQAGESVWPYPAQLAGLR